MQSTVTYTDTVCIQTIFLCLLRTNFSSFPHN